MNKKEANKKALKFFNQWQKSNKETVINSDFYDKREELKKECLKLHNVVGVYEVLTDKNALKMASICSSLRFVEPFKMLMKLQKTTNSY